MISQFKTSNTFSLATIQALKIWGDDNLINEIIPPPPLSGTIFNTVELIWEDMHGEPTGYPVATPYDFDSFTGTVYRSVIWGPQPEWAKIVGWGEIEAATSPLNGCGETICTSVNTQVEMTPTYMYYLLHSTGQWVSTRVNGTIPLAGGIYPGSLHGNPDLPSARPCTQQIFIDVRGDNLDYVVDKGRTGDVNQLYYPQHYYLEHYWATDGGVSIPDPEDIKSVYVCQFSRLVKIDPNGVNDFHLANFVTHLSADRKKSDGSALDEEIRDVNGINRYKLIPQDGSWMPSNSISGFATFEELEANPPPFPLIP